MCVSCGGPLYGRQAKFVLKYFLIERGPSRNLKALTARRFPPPWSVEELDACFVVRDHSGQKRAAKLLTKDGGERAEVHSAAIKKY
jgi:hypothetical protein